MAENTSPEVFEYEICEHCGEKQAVIIHDEERRDEDYQLWLWEQLECLDCGYRWWQPSINLSL